MGLSLPTTAVEQNLNGMKNNGILVTELLRVYDEHAQNRK